MKTAEKAKAKSKSVTQKEKLEISIKKGETYCNEMVFIREILSSKCKLISTYYNSIELVLRWRYVTQCERSGETTHEF